MFFITLRGATALLVVQSISVAFEHCVLRDRVRRELSAGGASRKRHLWVVKAASDMRPRASEQYLCFIMLWQHLYMLPNETWLTDCTVIALTEKCSFALLWQRQGIT